MQANRKEKVMSITTRIRDSAVSHWLQHQARHERQYHRDQRLRRELARLPQYVAHDLGAGHDQDRFVNYFDV